MPCSLCITALTASELTLSDFDTLQIEIKHCIKLSGTNGIKSTSSRDLSYSLHFYVYQRETYLDIIPWDLM